MKFKSKEYRCNRCKDEYYVPAPRGSIPCPECQYPKLSEDKWV